MYDNFNKNIANFLVKIAIKNSLNFQIFQFLHFQDKIDYLFFLQKNALGCKSINVRNTFSCRNKQTNNDVFFSMGSFSVGGDKMYCTTHYKQAFTEKGSYDIFTPKDKDKWTKKIQATSEETIKSQD